jgi:hypothetical protein
MYTSVSFEVDEAKLGCVLSGCHQPFCSVLPFLFNANAEKKYVLHRYNDGSTA